MGKQIESISKSDMQALEHYGWPGNVRELRNAVERAIILCTGSKLRVELPGAGSSEAQSSLALDDVQREHIRKVLALVGWRIRGKGGAAELLRMKPSTLESRMAKLAVRRPGR